MTTGTTGGRAGRGADTPDLELAVGLPPPLPRFALRHSMPTRPRLPIRHVLAHEKSTVEQAPTPTLRPLHSRHHMLKPPCLGTERCDHCCASASTCASISRCTTGMTGPRRILPRFPMTRIRATPSRCWRSMTRGRGRGRAAWRGSRDHDLPLISRMRCPAFPLRYSMMAVSEEMP